MTDAPLSLRHRLRHGPPLLAVFSIIAASEVVEMIGLAGFDAVILDTEHGPYGVQALGNLILAARARGLFAIVRVRTNEPSLIGAVLDAGAAGVLVPQVSSADAALKVVSAARFAPDGSRGANPWVRAADFTAGPEWFSRANREVAVMVMIEGKEGVAAAPEILNTPSLDAVFLGPVDLSHALGVPGETEHPLVIEQVGRVVAGATQRGMTTAVFAPTPKAARRWLDRGAGLVAVGVDSAHVLAGLRAVVAELRATSAAVG
jgi:2-keto-3-deoxy-L-rhamnonate aldolase RhmA